MKVRFAYTIDVSDEYRRAINLFYGKPGLATRDEVRRWIESHGTSEDDNLMFALTQAQEREEEQ